MEKFTQCHLSLSSVDSSASKLHCNTFPISSKTFPILWCVQEIHKGDKIPIIKSGQINIITNKT